MPTPQVYGAGWVQFPRLVVDALHTAVKDRRTRKAEQARTPYASNWRTVLAVDAGFGLLVLVAGLVVLFSVNVYVGAGVGAFAICYLVIIYRRYRYWAELRREAGLDT